MTPPVIWHLYATLRVYGDPKGQPRARAFSRGGKARVYDPGTAEGWKGQIAQAAHLHIGYLLDEPVRVDAVFLFARPARLLRKKDPEGRIRHVCKPDRDNLDKAVLDAFTGIGLWRDDCQACSGIIEKFYAAKGEAPGAEIRIYVEREEA